MARKYAMNCRNLPTREMVISNGQPVWRICGQGICLETGSGVTAQAQFDALCASMGLDPASGIAYRGPSEVDEPGV
jgi:hypothetical protein